MKEKLISSRINNALWVIVTLIPLIIIPIKGIPDIFNVAKAPVLVLGTLFIAYHLIQLKEIHLEQEAKPLIIYLALSLFASIMAYKPLLALSGVSMTAGRFEGFISIFFYAILFYAAKYHMRLNFKNTLFFIVVQSIIAAYAIMQFFMFDPLVEFLNYTRGSYATIGNQNFLASWALILLVIASGFYLKFRKYRYLIFPALFFGALLASNTRGCWLALMVISLASLYFLRFSNLRASYFKLLASFLIVFFTMNFFSESKIQHRTKTIKSELDINNEWAGSGRALIWKMSFDIVEAHPFLGAGPENLKEALKQTKNKRAIEYGVLTGHTVDKAHNDFLHIAAVSGTPALLFYIFFIFSLLVKQRKNIFNCSVQSTIALTVFAYLIQSLFNISVIAVAPLFWVLLGLLANKNQQVST